MNKTLKAILAGAAVDMGGSTFALGIFSITYLAVVKANGATLQQLYTAPFTSFGFLCAFTLIGLLFNAIGGFVAARMVSRQHILVGAAAAFPCLFLGLFNLLNPLPNFYPLWVILVGWVLGIPSAATGGYIGRKFGSVPSSPL